MKKKILFSMDTMMCGGIEKSALSLLSSLDPDRFDVTLCLDKMTGEFLELVPNWVTIKAVEYDETDKLENTLGAKNLSFMLFRQGKIYSLIKRMSYISREKIMSKDRARISKANRYYERNRRDQTVYDLAVAYSNMEQFIYVDTYIKAKRKLGWFHTQIDVSRENIIEYAPVLKHFDTLFCVSENLVASTAQHLPEIKDKLKFFPHIFNAKILWTMAAKDTALWDHSDRLNLLSVGRLSYEKGFDLILLVASKLKNDNINFQWVILGEGSEKTKLQNMIDSLGLVDYVKLAGLSLNPYPYFKTCDIYVQPSRIEGFGITIAEAKIFGKPIVSTLTDGAKDQIDHGVNGVLVECNVDNLYTALKDLLMNEKLRQSFSDYLRSQQMDNTEGVDLFLREVEMIN